MVDIGGYAGKTLRINLTDGKISEEVYDEAFLRKYLGGTALGVKLLYDEVPRDIEYDDPRNMYFIGTGPLSGTVVGGSGAISVVTKGALTCRFNTRMNHKRLAAAISAATGWDMRPDEAWDIGRRAVNLMRAFNLQTGLSAEHDRPSFRYGSTPVDGPTEGISIQPHWDEMLRNYYGKMGWDPESGVPTKETLERLGIGPVWDNL